MSRVSHLPAREPFFSRDGDAPAKRVIMVEALRLFTSKGLCETSIRHIAEATGYTNPALYKHFASKDELALQLFIACYGEAQMRVEAAMRDCTSSAQKVKALVHSYTAGLDAYPEVSIYTNDNLSRFWPRVPAAMKKRTVLTVMRELVVAGARSSSRAPEEVEVTIAAIAGTLSQFGRMLYLGGIRGPAHLWNEHLEKVITRLIR